MLAYRAVRRSQRVCFRVPVTVSWTPPAGRAVVKESTETQVVSAHGALIRLRQELARDTRLEIMHQRTQELAFARVAWVGQPENPDDPYPVGVELSVPSQTFWGIPFVAARLSSAR